MSKGQVSEAEVKQIQEHRAEWSDGVLNWFVFFVVIGLALQALLVLRKVYQEQAALFSVPGWFGLCGLAMLVLGVVCLVMKAPRTYLTSGLTHYWRTNVRGYVVDFCYVEGQFRAIISDRWTTSPTTFAQVAIRIPLGGWFARAHVFIRGKQSSTWRAKRARHAPQLWVKVSSSPGDQWLTFPTWFALKFIDDNWSNGQWSRIIPHLWENKEVYRKGMDAAEITAKHLEWRLVNAIKSIEEGIEVIDSTKRFGHSKGGRDSKALLIRRLLEFLPAQDKRRPKYEAMLQQAQEPADKEEAHA